MSDPHRRRQIEGRALAAIAVARRLPTFEDVGMSLRDVSRAELVAALDALVKRGLVVVETFPSKRLPLLDPPTICYKSVALQGGFRHG